MVRAAVLLVGAIVLLAGCTGGGSSAEPPAGSTSTVTSAPAESSTAVPPEESPASPAAPTGPLSYEEILVDGTYTTEAICTEYRTKIAKYAKAAKGRVTSGSGSAQGPYEAASYRRTHEWVKDELAARFDESLEASARKALNSVSGNRAAELDSIDAYFRDSIESCGLSKALQAARSQARKADSLGERIIRQARLKPWYPKGYSPLGDDLAYDWVGNPNCDYYTRCTEAYFVSRDGCYGGLYVEVNVVAGSTVIGWTNDTASSLAPGQRARLKFSTYNDTPARHQISEWSCY